MTRETITIEEIISLQEAALNAASMKVTIGDIGVALLNSPEEAWMDFLGAAPRIAAKAIELDTVNKELIEALKTLAFMNKNQIENRLQLEMKDFIEIALDKAGAL